MPEQGGLEKMRCAETEDGVVYRQFDSLIASDFRKKRDVISEKAGELCEGIHLPVLIE